jgi:hypothetical protein
VRGNARIVESSAQSNPHATLDLPPAFAGQAQRVTRRFELDSDRTATIRDELIGVAPGTEVRWALVTHAVVALDENRATLKQDGKELQVRLNSPAGATFSVIPADPPGDGFNAPNPDTRILIVTVKAPASGRVQLDVALRPGKLE